MSPRQTGPVAARGPDHDAAWGRARLGGLAVGAGAPVAVMGVLNVSPESFYAGSVRSSPETLLEAALAMVEAGAALIDVGARSTAPYRATDIDEGEESLRLGRAVGILAPRLRVPISADTARPGPAREALERGATVINDVSGLADPALARLVAQREAGLVLMASPADTAPSTRADPLTTVARCLAVGLDRARAAGIPAEHIALDPGIGFFRGQAVAWDAWDVAVLADLERLLGLGHPLAVAVSRKSFLGTVTGRASPADRLPGSLAATALAVAHGASVVRTHDVGETLDAVRLAERVRAARGRGDRPSERSRHGQEQAEPGAPT